MTQFFTQPDKHKIDRGDFMQDGTAYTYRPQAMQEVKLEIKLAVNERLYRMTLITEEMYTKAKNIILKEEEDNGYL
ncbi:MAG: hypothetical protein RR185_08855 [Angelakisella sp.]